MERINKEFKRESRLIGVFPNQESVLRLTVSRLIDRNEDGTTENKYLINRIVVKKKINGYRSEFTENYACCHFWQYTPSYVKMTVLSSFFSLQKRISRFH
jgi:hypothetical protein